MRQVILCLLVAMILVISACEDKKTNEIIMNLNNNWEFHQVGKDNWLPAKVPGCVHTDLLNNGIIEDPFYRLNEHDQQWIDKEDWEYKTTFRAGHELFAYDKLFIEFKGLDTYADVYLNDSLILRADNMFREWQVDCRPYIKIGRNELKIFFHSPIKIGLEKLEKQGYEIPVSNNDLSEIGKLGDKKVSIYTRKAGYHYGWDWGPRFVTSGIWRPVYLRGWNTLKILDTQVCLDSISEKKALLTINASVRSLIESENYSVSVIVDGELITQEPIKLYKGDEKISVAVAIPNPRLWWPNGLGEHYLYNIQIQIAQNKNILASQSIRTGLRTLEVVQQKDEFGSSFYFKINGHPVFIKGANFIPQDIFVNRVTPQMYEHTLQTAVDCNMNMIRVWGGGIYENDILYDLCDEKGLLVWQDFMFACSMYPGDSAYLENVKQEAVDNVLRLRNHPCLALWCGNNEILSGWRHWGYLRETLEQYGQDTVDLVWKAYENVFLKILPDVIAKYDSVRYYHSSSPSAGFGLPESFTEGDIHYWGVWWGKEPFSTYRTVKSRFFSEYGFQSFPAFTSVEKYTSAEDYDIYSPVMASHQRSTIGNVTIEEYMLRDYRKPKDFRSFLYVSQVLQAEGIKTAIKLHRKNKPYTMGTLYWQLDDCWPVASWSGMDYYGQWKALQYFSKKAYREIIIAADEYNNETTVNVVSDRLDSANLALVLSLVDFSGDTLWTMHKEIKLGPNENIKPYYMATSKLLDGSKPQDVMLLVALKEDEKIIDEDILYFSPIKDIDLPKPFINKTITKINEGYAIELNSDKLAKNVFLSAGELDFDGFFSDNYFDMIPGKNYMIVFKTKKDIADFGLKLKVISLADSY